MVAGFHTNIYPLTLICLLNYVGNCVWNSSLCCFSLSSVLQRTWKTFPSCSTMHRRRFFTPLPLSMTLKTNRSAIFGNETPTAESLCLRPGPCIYLYLYIQNDWLINDTFFVLQFPPSSLNLCVSEHWAEYSTFPTRTMTESSVMLNSTDFR